jgi:hypothetical protein
MLLSLLSTNKTQAQCGITITDMPSNMIAGMSYTMHFDGHPHSYDTTGLNGILEYNFFDTTPNDFTITAYDSVVTFICNNAVYDVALDSTIQCSDTITLHFFKPTFMIIDTTEYTPWMHCMQSENHFPMFYNLFTDVPYDALNQMLPNMYFNMEMPVSLISEMPDPGWGSMVEIHMMSDNAFQLYWPMGSDTVFSNWVHFDMPNVFNGTDTTYMGASDWNTGATRYNITIPSGADVSWTNQWYNIRGKIIIESGATLRLNNTTLRFTQNDSIIIRPNGRLIIENSRLTNYNECSNYWGGINIEGYPSFDLDIDSVYNDLYPNSRYTSGQGIVVSKNSIIENARIALFSYRFGTEFSGYCGTPINYTLNLFDGSLLAFSNTQFINNGCDMLLGKATKAPFDVKPNQSFFKNYKFETNPYGYYLDTEIETGVMINTINYLPKVYLFKNEGIRFAGCQFLNDYGGFGDFSFQSSPIAIDGYLSSVKLINYGTQPNTFNNLPKAIQINNYSPNARATTVDSCTFTNCLKGLHIKGSSNDNVFDNRFFIPTSATDTTYGLHLEGCTGFGCEGNMFTGMSSGGAAPSQYGAYITSSGTAGDRFYRNRFSYIGNALGTSGDNTGLQVKCNNFNAGVDYDWNVFGVLPNQGKCLGFNTLTPAGNTFTPSPVNAEGHIYMDAGATPFEYRRHSAPPDVIPTNITSTIDVANCGSPKTVLSCPDNYVYNINLTNVEDDYADVYHAWATLYSAYQANADVALLEEVREVDADKSELINQAIKSNAISKSELIALLASYEKDYIAQRNLAVLYYNEEDFEKSGIALERYSNYELADKSFYTYQSFLNSVGMNCTKIDSLNESELILLMDLQSSETREKYAANAILTQFYKAEKQEAFSFPTTAKGKEKLTQNKTNPSVTFNNPAHDVLQINCSDCGSINVKIFTIEGQLLTSQNILHKGEINTANYVTGLYYLSIDNATAYKLIISK